MRIELPGVKIDTARAQAQPARNVSREAAVWIFSAAGVVAAWRLRQVLLLVFAGVVFAVFLRGLADWLERRVRVPRRWSLTAAVATLFAALALLAGLVWPQLSGQFEQLQKELPAALDRAREQAPWLEKAIVQARESASGGRVGGAAARALGVFSTLLGALGGLAAIFVTGLYFASSPGEYLDGCLRLLRPDRRPRARALADELGATLRGWLVGKFVAMGVIAVFSGAGLAVLGVPAPLALAGIAGLLNFIPNLGPLVSAVPALLLSAAKGGGAALGVLALYAAIQALENYVITPKVQRRAVHMPPALLLSAQLAFAVLAGFLGLLLATPVTACALVLIRELRVKEIESA